MGNCEQVKNDFANGCFLFGCTVLYPNTYAIIIDLKTIKSYQATIEVNHVQYTSYLSYLNYISYLNFCNVAIYTYICNVATYVYFSTVGG